MYELTTPCLVVYFRKEPVSSEVRRFWLDLLPLLCKNLSELKSSLGLL